MTRRNRTFHIVTLTVAAAALVGCGEVGLSSPNPVEPVDSTPVIQPKHAKYLPRTAVGPTDGGPEADSAVDEAVGVHKKLNGAMEKLLAQQEANQALAEENRQLKGQVDKLQTQLEDAEQELADANEMLVTMREDLKEWKGNVLGFRKEQQQALLAIVKSQQRILTLLGAESSDQAVIMRGQEQ
ncbi:MAG: hypothetical protein ACOC93_01265 [Planctomycetota bacterium]